MFPIEYIAIVWVLAANSLAAEETDPSPVKWGLEFQEFWQIWKSKNMYALQFPLNFVPQSCEGSLCILCWPTHNPKPHLDTDTAFGLLISSSSLVYIISSIRIPCVSYTLPQLFMYNTYVKSNYLKEIRFWHKFHYVTVPYRETIHTVVNKFRLAMDERELKV